jgi:hypothetical protein
MEAMTSMPAFCDLQPFAANRFQARTGPTLKAGGAVGVIGLGLVEAQAAPIWLACRSAASWPAAGFCMRRDSAPLRGFGILLTYAALVVAAGFLLTLDRLERADGPKPSLAPAPRRARRPGLCNDIGASPDTPWPDLP